MMSAEDNKRNAKDGYAAFAAGDAEGAMRNIDDAIVWTVRGANSLTGTYSGKQEVGELWGKFLEAGFSSEVHKFVADGDTVVALVTAQLDGEEVAAADVLTYNDDGKLISFDTLGDETATNRVFAR